MTNNILLGKTVLVAEDGPINQMVVKHTLAKLGAITDIAVDGSAAIEKLKEYNYDLVLMDIQMPGMDGHEATGYIRNCLLSNIPIIAMTAHAWDDEVKKCYESGMNGYVAKPFTVDKLGMEIERVLSESANTAGDPNILCNGDTSVDISMLYEISGDDEEYISLMVQTFLQNMPDTLKKIEAGLAGNDWEAVYKAAHFAKSSLSIIKVDQMLDAVLLVEGNAKKKVDLHTVPALVVKMNESFLKAREVLSKKFTMACNSTAS